MNSLNIKFLSHKVVRSILMAIAFLLLIFILTSCSKSKDTQLNEPGLFVTWSNGGIVYSEDGTLWETVDAKVLLKEDYMVRSTSNSGATLQALDASTIRLSENTELKIEDLSDSEVEINQGKGKAFYRVKNDDVTYIVNALSHKIESSDSAFDISVNQKESRINVKALDGEVNVTANLDKTEKYILKKGKEITIDPNTETKIVVSDIPASYLTSSWYMSNEDGSADDFDGADEESTDNKEENGTTTSAPAKTTTTTTTTKSTTSTSTYSGGCKPWISGRKESKFNGIVLSWSTCKNSDFQFYKLVRSNLTSSPSYPANSAIFSSSNRSAASFIDKTVAPATTYYYRVCVVQRLNKVSCGNVVKVSY